jgi:hypothetical protein
MLDDVGMGSPRRAGAFRTALLQVSCVLLPWHAAGQHCLQGNLQQLLAWQKYLLRHCDATAAALALCVRV